MTYERAQQILNFTSNMSRQRRAELAKVNLSTYTHRTPLRYKVACAVIIDGANNQQDAK